MSSPFAFLRSATNRAHKTACKLADGMYDSVIDADKWNDCYQAHFQIGCNAALMEIERMMVMKELIGERLTDLLTHERDGGETPSDKKNYFFITVRPDDTMCTFDDFKHKILDLVKRKCFIEYTLSFEQAGKNVSDMGKGFHCHIVAKMKQSSKSNVLRDVTSSFKPWIESRKITTNNIEVVSTRNPEQLIQSYLINYESEDGHKSLTKSIDELWRSSNDIAPLYALSLTSP